MSASGYYYMVDGTLYELPEAVSNIKGIQSRMVTADGYTYVDMSDFSLFEIADVIDFLTREFNLEVLIKFLAYVQELDNFNFDAYSTRFLDMMNIFHGDNAWVPFNDFMDNFGSRKIYKDDQTVKEAMDEGAFAAELADTYENTNSKKYVDISLDYNIADYTVSKEEEEAVLRIYSQLQDINKDWADIMLYSVTASQKFHKVVIKNAILIDKITEQVNAAVPPACYAFNYMILRMYLEETVDRRRKTPMKLYDELIFQRFPDGFPTSFANTESRLAVITDSKLFGPTKERRNRVEVEVQQNANKDSFKRLAPYAVASPYNFFPVEPFLKPRYAPMKNNGLYLTSNSNSFYFEDRDFFGGKSFSQIFEEKVEPELRESLKFWFNNGAVLTGSAIPSLVTNSLMADYDVLLPSDDGTKLALLIEAYKQVYPDSAVEKKADYKYHIMVGAQRLEVFANRETASKVISNFHVPCVRAFFDGNILKFLPSFLIAMKTGLLVDYRYINANTGPDAIIVKYGQKGFSFVINQAESSVLASSGATIPYNPYAPYVTFENLPQGYKVYKQLMTNSNNVIQAFSLDALYTLMKQ